MIVNKSQLCLRAYSIISCNAVPESYLSILKDSTGHRSYITIYARRNVKCKTLKDIIVYYVRTDCAVLYKALRLCSLEQDDEVTLSR